MLRRYFIILLFSHLASCKSPNEHNYLKDDQLFHQVSIRDRLGEEEGDLEELFYDLMVTEFVLPDSILVSQIDKMIFHKQKFILFDKNLSLLLVFDLNGYFIGKIGELGLGPGQYQGIKDFSVWEDTLTIFSTADLRLFQYSLTNLGFLGSSKIEFFGNSMVQLSNNEFMFYINHNPSDFVKDKNVLYYNKNTGETKTFFPYDHSKSNAVIPFSGFISKQGYEVFFSLPFDDKVYVFDQEKLDFFLKYKTDNVNDFVFANRGDFQKFLFEGLFQDPANGVSVLGNVFLKNDNYLAFSYYLKGRLYYGIYSLVSNGFKTFSKGFENDISFKLVGEPMMLNTENELIFISNSETIEYFRKQGGIEESLFGRMFKDIDSVNSLYLLKMKIKPF
jgi:hypothetical protein